MESAGNAKGGAVATFDTVTQRAKRILIIASGKSAADMDMDLVRQAKLAGVYVLAVNRSWDWCKPINGWFTLDPDDLVMKYITAEPCGVQRFVAVPEDYGKPDARVSYHRNVERSPNVSYLRRFSGRGPLRSAYDLAENPSNIHTGNSAWGALGLAYHMKPERIALIGVDANRNTGYAHANGKPRTNLRHLPDLFRSAVDRLSSEGIEVCNGSPDSRVLCFVRRDPNRTVKWIME